jgi:hypothetical protein
MWMRYLAKLKYIYNQVSLHHVQYGIIYPAILYPELSKYRLLRPSVMFKMCANNSSGIRFFSGGATDVWMFLNRSMVKACTQWLFTHIFSSFFNPVHIYPQSLCLKDLQDNLCMTRLPKGSVYRYLHFGRRTMEERYMWVINTYFLFSCIYSCVLRASQAWLPKFRKNPLSSNPKVPSMPDKWSHTVLPYFREENWTAYFLLLSWPLTWKSFSRCEMKLTSWKSRNFSFNTLCKEATVLDISRICWTFS